MGVTQARALSGRRHTLSRKLFDQIVEPLATARKKTGELNSQAGSPVMPHDALGFKRPRRVNVDPNWQSVRQILAMHIQSMGAEVARDTIAADRTAAGVKFDRAVEQGAGKLTKTGSFHDDLLSGPGREPDSSIW
jgi:hypothetical protein